MRYDAEGRWEQRMEWWWDYTRTELRSCKSLEDLQSCLSRLVDEAGEDGLELEDVVEWGDVPSYGGPGMAPTDEAAVSWDDERLLLPANGGGWEIVRRED